MQMMANASKSATRPSARPSFCVRGSGRDKGITKLSKGSATVAQGSGGRRCNQINCAENYLRLKSSGTTDGISRATKAGQILVAEARLSGATAQTIYHPRLALVQHLPAEVILLRMKTGGSAVTSDHLPPDFRMKRGRFRLHSHCAAIVKIMGPALPGQLCCWLNLEHPCGSKPSIFPSRGSTFAQSLIDVKLHILQLFS